ncbi:SpaA isopeptide-forming pilin-related protein, partial [Virgibacillus sp. W0181]|uniref:SpaA isopeptide-forming pilin-related protein n=1 Tax=Virgibacillus sp. W0181 TaxID=3391581 RepID=UPI003F47A368
LATDETGTLVVDDLKPGNYQFVETATIPGYDLDATPIPFEIAIGQTEAAEVSFENPLSTGSVELTKVGEEGNTLAGAEFTLENGAGEKLLTGLTTNEAGILVVEDLKPGNYAFIETKAPFGYQLDDTPITFEIVFNQQTAAEVQAENQYLPSTFELTKEGEDGQLLEGVTFALQDANGSPLREGLLTNEAGKLTIDDLTPGSYQLVETATVPGYDLDTTPIPFEIGLGQTNVTEVTFENPLSTGSVELTKVGEEGDTLAGAEFSLVDEAGDELQTGLTTNEEGLLVVEDLKPGNYAFVETKAPFGYELDNTPHEFEIVFNQQERLTLEAENALTTGSVELTKLGEDGSTLEGVVFELQDDTGTTLQENLATDETGTLVVDDLKPGNYQFVETATIPGYDLDATPIPFEIAIGQTEAAEVSFENPLSTGSVELTKVGEEGNTLAGAEFTLENGAGEKLLTGLTTNEAGILVVEDLKPGNYAFIETKAPFGYQLDDTPITFEIVFNQQTAAEVQAENQYLPSTFELTKEGEDGQLLEGVTFALQDANGSPLREGLLTNEAGKLTIDDLTPGSYQLVETATVPGYDLDTTPIPFEIGLGQTNVTEVTFENPLSTGSVELTKVGEEGDTLAGAEFSLVDEAGDELQTGLTTNEEGLLVVEDLKPGNYAFVETKAPFGYELEDIPIEFEIVFNQQEPMYLDFKNNLLKTALQIVKVDATTDAALRGAVFDIFNSEEKLISTVTTNANGMATVNGLTPGEYQLVETKAPFGYVKLERSLDITIELGDNKKEVIVENTPKETEEKKEVGPPSSSNNNFGDKLPQTGEEWLRYAIVLGLMFVGVGSFLLYTHIRRIRKTEF